MRVGKLLLDILTEVTKLQHAHAHIMSLSLDITCNPMLRPLGFLSSEMTENENAAQTALDYWSK